MGAVNTVVIPAAGLGTRFLPATKALPKEMVPVGDRPAIQWGLEEASASGLSRAVVVVSPGKELIAAHLRADPELEAVLCERGKPELAERIRQVSQSCQVEYAEQLRPLGLGHAVLCAAELVRGEPAVAAMLPDDLFVGSPPLLEQLLEVYRREGCTVLALRRCPADEISRYGVAAVEGEGPVFRVRDVVEKPSPDLAPSDLAVMGRYVLTAAVFRSLADTPPGSGGEIQLTDGIRRVLGSERVVGLEFSGRLLDVGTLEGWLVSNNEVALADPDLGPPLRRELERLLSRDASCPR